MLAFSISVATRLVLQQGGGVFIPSYYLLFIV